jgi:CRP-like cAMP-binding protein
VAKLIDGSAFGELALLEQKPRMATIRCLKNSHFMVLTKEDYNKVIGKIEKRTYNEKINFLRNIPVLHLLTRTSLGKMTYYFENKSCIRDSYLYKEGDIADYVYIVKSGEFQATKRIIHTKAKEERIEDILENPLKANKNKNNLFARNTMRSVERINVSITFS